MLIGTPDTSQTIDTAITQCRQIIKDMNNGEIIEKDHNKSKRGWTVN
jgi:hypothetical protein